MYIVIFRLNLHHLHYNDVNTYNNDYIVKKKLQKKNIYTYV